MLEEGKSIALVTNAGTPGVSDPGYTLVRSTIEAGIPVTMIPGASAVLMALVLSGLPVHSFTFRGFPPHKAGPRRRFLEADREGSYTLVYYESPYRLKGFLKDALMIFGDRQAAVANDLTKLFERINRGNLSEMVKIFDETEPRGEYTVVIAGV
jgi:16S rRNA (cytidine1402-2'-O)-methyltransferase